LRNFLREQAIADYILREGFARAEHLRPQVEAVPGFVSGARAYVF